MFLQSTVLPFVLCDRAEGVWIRRLVGTGFLVSNVGHILTARHVIEDGLSKAQSENRTLAAVVKGLDGNSPGSGVAMISDYEFAPSPFDVALCTVAYRAETQFRLGGLTDNLWRDIATLGYPSSALAHPMTVNGMQNWRINLRANKGYVQREVKPDDMAIGDHPDGFELSFLVGPGMSGAPIFVHQGDTDFVIGVAVSSFRSEILDYEHLEVNDDGSKYAERKVKIEEFGFAHDISGLSEWVPRLLGRPLFEAHLAQ